jgi:gluconolactonase
VSGGGAGSGGAAAGSGSGGAGNSAGASQAWRCPAGTFSGNPIPAGAVPTRIAGAPPTADAFNMYAFGNVEGPVWLGDGLYFSDMKNGDLPPSRILKITESDVVSIFIADSGSNGLAVDMAGNLVTANHGKQGIVRFHMPDATPSTLVSTYGGKPFNCPNDLAIRSDGTIYFTDPTHQNEASPPQGGPSQGTRVYQLLPGASSATVITDYLNQPNGITLSLDEQTLIVDGGDGVKKYPITAGVVATTGTPFGPSDVTNINTDGMVLDCAGNLYVPVVSSTNLFVIAPDGTKIGTIVVDGPSAVTNAAFGGSDHRMLYITGQGNDTQRGVFKMHMNFPGMPY